MREKDGRLMSKMGNAAFKIVVQNFCKQQRGRRTPSPNRQPATSRSTATGDTDAVTGEAESLRQKVSHIGLRCKTQMEKPVNQSTHGPSKKSTTQTRSLEFGAGESLQSSQQPWKLPLSSWSYAHIVLGMHYCTASS